MLYVIGPNDDKTKVALMNCTKFLLTTLIAVSAGLAGCRTTAEVLQVGAAAEKNPGPCPRAFSLFDAARIVEFKGEQRFSNVGFTGEVDAVRSLCRYYAERPIDADLEIDFSLGRGPAAEQSTAHYEYFVAVTRKNIGVIEKQIFPLTVTFPEGADRMVKTERIGEILIPRKAEGTSGENFEIIVGFVVTPEQRAFNTEGRRFRVSAGQPR